MIRRGIGCLNRIGYPANTFGVANFYNLVKIDRQSISQCLIGFNAKR
jgi:hypothetical protein